MTVVTAQALVVVAQAVVAVAELVPDFRVLRVDVTTTLEELHSVFHTIHALHCHAEVEKHLVVQRIYVTRFLEDLEGFLRPAERIQRYTPVDDGFGVNRVQDRKSTRLNSSHVAI